ncbi:MAG: exported protein of unknown function [Promethearchaeota archaeon]|nr:MAG: exported protein of unknown function [Candidatus Lokiarchaeota archaeon]
MKKKILLGFILFSTLFGLILTTMNSEENKILAPFNPNRNLFIESAATSLTVSVQVDEFQVNVYNSSDQTMPSICALSENTFAVVWESSGQDSDDTKGIYARVFNATTGINTTAEIQINYEENDIQKIPSICALSEDRVAIAWESNTQDGNFYGVFARVLNTTSGEFSTASDIQVNNYTTYNQWEASICALSEDTFAVAWMSQNQDEEGYGIYSRVFNATTGVNTTAEFQINFNETNNQWHPSICALSEDILAVAWESEEQDGNGWGVFARVFNITSGEFSTASDIQVNYNTTNDQRYPSICALSEDRFAVVWQSNETDGDIDGYGIHARVFDATTGSNTTAEIQVNYNTTNDQDTPSICALSEDTFGVAWESDEQDGEYYGIFARIFNATTGENITAEFQVNKQTNQAQTCPAICGLSENSFAVAWQDGWEDVVPGKDIFAGVFMINEAPLVNIPSPSDDATATTINPTLQVEVSDADGHDITVYFYDNSTGTPIYLGMDTVSSGGPGNASFQWNGRAYGTEYRWFVNASDGIVNTTSSIWSFTTKAAPENPLLLLLLTPSEQQIPGYHLFLILMSIGAGALILSGKKIRTY